MANYASTRTTQLYDRRRDDIGLDKVYESGSISLGCLQRLERFHIYT